MRTSGLTKIEAIVDTCILIDLLRGNQNALDFFTKTRYSSLGLSAVTVLELRTPRDKVTDKQVRATEDLLRRFEVLAPTGNDWSRALNLYRDRFRNRAPRPKWSDLLIAETARGRGLTVVTRDLTDFQLIESVSISVPYSV